jgi:hypothetical protein
MSKFAFAVVAAVCVSLWAPLEVGPHRMGDLPRTLSRAEQAGLRDAIHRREMLTAFPEDGPWARFNILVLPEAVEALKGPKTKAALALLLGIVKAQPSDNALLAAGFAFALAGDPVYGCIVASAPREGFDRVDEFFGETPRRKLIREVQKVVNTAK